MSGLKEVELVRAAQGGSDAAFARLVGLHQAGLRGFLHRASGAGWAEADDLAQDAFVTAWTKLSTLKDPAGFRPWLIGIAWRRAQTRIRGARRGAARDAAWLETRPTPAGVAAEDRLAMIKAMEALVPIQRACVSLCLAQGWSHMEAAVALGLAVGTVKSHVGRGRARLLSALGGADDA